MNEDGTFKEHERWELPMYLPSRFRSWCDFYAYLMRCKIQHGWDPMPKSVHISELGELSEETNAQLVQTFKIKKVKAMAFDELWEALPDRRTASGTLSAINHLFNGGPGAQDSNEWVHKLFKYLPNVKQ